MTRRRGAFTLIETIIALAVFAIAVVGCATAIATITRTVAVLRMEGEARRSLENHAAEIRGQRPFPKTAAPSQPVPAKNGILITDKIEPVVDAEAGIENATGLFRVRMTAAWKTGETAQTVTHTILVRRAE